MEITKGWRPTSYRFIKHYFWN